MDSFDPRQGLVLVNTVQTFAFHNTGDFLE